MGGEVMSHFDPSILEGFLSSFAPGRYPNAGPVPSKAWLAGLSGDAHKCGDKRELGDWFRGFSEACRRARK